MTQSNTKISIYKDFGFLIKANDKKPMINLQWLFNKKYYKRFN